MRTTFIVGGFAPDTPDFLGKLRASRFASLALVLLVLLVLLALLALLTGCTPIAGLRPASGLLPDKRLEIGGGAAIIGPRPFVDEPTRGTGQLWATGSPSRYISLSAIGAFDKDAVAVGGAVRLDYLRTGRVATGIEAEGGYAWAGMSLPFAVRLFDETWLYTGPRVGTRSYDWALEVPAGISVRVQEGLMVRAEYRISWVELDPFTRRSHAALALAYQF